jgi:hypothetical protein
MQQLVKLTMPPIWRPRSTFGNRFSTVIGSAGQLFLRGVTGAQGHGHKLSDRALFNTEAVEPGLFRGYDVVLGFLVQAVAPLLAGDRVDLAGGDLDGEGILDPVAVDLDGVEVHPHGFGLVHGEHDAAVAHPVCGDAVGVVVDVAEGKAAETRRQVVSLAVVGDTQRALEVDAETGVGMDFGEAEDELVVAEFDHRVVTFTIRHP